MDFISSLKTSIKVPTVKELKKNSMPIHVAIIMDGNGRWAVKRKLPRIAGHRAGVKTLKEAVMTSIELGIKYLTVYAFSSENWQRPQQEIKALMDLFVETLEKELDSLYRNGVKLVLVGRREFIPPRVLKSFEYAEQRTKNNSRLVLNIAFNYGSRQEIITAVKRIYKDLQENRLKLEELEENVFSRFLYTRDCPDPDLLIRTSGEYRLSNFLMWQIAYTELYFIKTLWPDFNKRHFLKAIYNYQRRNRRFGRI